MIGFSPGFAINDTKKTEASLSSNIVPMYRGFKTGTFQGFENEQYI